MKLEQAAEAWGPAELESVLDFWADQPRSWPQGEHARREWLAHRMGDSVVVEDRLKLLPSALRAVLRHVAVGRGSRGYLDLDRLDESELPVSGHEMPPILQALSARGFLVGQRARPGGRYGAFALVDEVGGTLERVLGRRGPPLEARFALRDWLQVLDRPQLEAALTAIERPQWLELAAGPLRSVLLQSDEIDARIDRLSAPLRRVVAGCADHGGVVGDGARRRLELDVDARQLLAWGEELEAALLGSYVRAELVNHGLAVGEGWLIVFREVAAELIDRIELDVDEAETSALGAPDALHALRTIARSLEDAPPKVRRTGEMHKSALKRIAADLGAAHDEQDAQLWLDVLTDQELVRTSPQSTLELTSRWREWERRPASEQAAELLAFARRVRHDDASPLHALGLRRALLRELESAGFGAWLAFDAAIARARNEHLREAVRPEQALRYQDRHKRAPFPPLATPDKLKRSLEAWTTDVLARLGIVELARPPAARRPMALRLTALGASALGLAVRRDRAPRAGLIVGADYELVLFPENVGFDRVQDVARFAERIKADYAIHFRLTRASVQEAVAGGLTEAAILGLLDELSDHEIPQNVAYSISEWAAATLRVSLRRSWLLEAPDEPALARLLAIPEVKALVVAQHGPLVLELKEDPAASGLTATLREQGVWS